MILVYKQFSASSFVNAFLISLSNRKSEYEDLLNKIEESQETQISTVDPDARLMDNKKGGLDVAYNIQATVDAKNGLVIDQYVIIYIRK